MEDRTFIIGVAIISVVAMIPFWGIVAKGEYQVYNRKKEDKNMPIGGKKTKRPKGKSQTYKK